MRIRQFASLLAVLILSVAFSAVIFASPPDKNTSQDTQTVFVMSPAEMPEVFKVNTPDAQAAHSPPSTASSNIRRTAYKSKRYGYTMKHRTFYPPDLRRE